MPQREFWTNRIPTAFTVEYRSDPKDPEADVQVELHVLDQARESMEWSYIRLPWNVCYEAVASIMASAWEGYLFGEPGAMSKAAHSQAQHWRAESMIRLGIWE